MIYDCVGMGIAVLDELAGLDAFPLPDSKNTLRFLHEQGGGPVPNALATLGRLGKRCALVSAMGRDRQALLLCRELRKFNVETSYIQHLAGVPTSRAIILINSSTGERTVLLRRHPDCSLEKSEELAAPINKCRILHLDGHEPVACLRAATLARRHGAQISLDIGSSRSLSSELMELADILIVSESYSRKVIGKNPEKSVEELAQAGAKLTGVTCGIHGSYLYRNGETWYQPCFKVKTVDSTGAGDVYHGAAVYGVLQDFSLQQISQFASAAAALKCQHLGGKKGIPEMTQIRTFLEYHEVDVDFLS